MAEKVIFAEQTVTGFELNSSFSCYFKAVSPSPFVLEDGQTYRITWNNDTDEYQAITANVDGMDFVCVGNGVVIGGEDNGKKFAMGYNATTDFMNFFALEAGESHRIAVYQIMEEEETETPEGIVLKDRNGNDVAYYGIETVTFDTTTEGKQQTYTKGVAVEDLEIVPDFSGGDVTVKAPDGTLVKSAVIKKPTVESFLVGESEGAIPLDFSSGESIEVTPSAESAFISKVIIQKPETLVPKNIAEGVDIAGVVGTMSAGGGVYTQYTLNDDGEVIKAKMYGYTAIPKGQFAYMTYLKEVDLSESPGITTIGERAFSYCTALTSFIVPDGVVSIGDYAFSYCAELSSFELPDSVTTIGKNMLYSCSKLTSVNLHDNITSIGEGIFSYCSSLQTVAIPSNMIKIPHSMFVGCKALESITIPSTVTSIGGMAFLGCSGLTSITIPSSVKLINSQAFQNCTGLTSATFADKYGWYVTTTAGASSGKNVTLTNSATAATYLTTTYYAYYWYDAS